MTSRAAGLEPAQSTYTPEAERYLVTRGRSRLGCAGRLCHECPTWPLLSSTRSPVWSMPSPVWRRAGWPWAWCSTSPTRSRAGAAGTRSSARPCDEGAAPRRRDAVAAWVAGAGAGGVVSARGGDAVRVLVLARRSPGTGCALLTGTLVAEAVGECALGARACSRSRWRSASGRSVGPSTTSALYVAAGVLALTGLRAARPPLGARARASSRAPRTAARRCACPKAYARDVLPWQLASRVLRLAALGCFLAAFGLPATPAAVLLVVFAQSSGRLVPFSPASVGAGAAILAATFEPVTGTAVPAAQVAAFFVGTSTVLTVVGTALALVTAAAQASAKVGPSFGPAGRPLDADPRGHQCRGRSPRRWRRRRRSCRRRSGCRWRPRRGR